MLNSEDFIRLLSADHYTEDDLQEVNDICRSYPMFNIAHMLKVRILEKLSLENRSELRLAAVYTSDRRKLFEFVSPGQRQSQYSRRERAVERRTDLQFSYGEQTQADIVISRDDGPVILSDLELLELDHSEVDVDTMSEDEFSEGDFSEEVVPIVEKQDVDMEEPEELKDFDVPAIDLIEEGDESIDGTTEEEEEIKDSVDPELDVEEGSEKLKTEEEGEMEDSVDQETDLDIGSEDLKAEEEIEMEDSIDTETDEDEEIEDVDSAEGRTSVPEEQGGNLIERFITKEPGPIRADKVTTLKGDASVESIKENDYLITDTLAKIYLKQGLHAKAIYAYERLSLKFPEKSAYFAAQIEKIENITNS